ncbi:unnamed protein product [Linum trigynum]|uniref:Uncharacterized protein n=1 Tax=Linum trigynum TaxID=586398 RepID=A0AAV2DAD9_9ROSI
MLTGNRRWLTEIKSVHRITGPPLLFPLISLPTQVPTPPWLSRRRIFVALSSSIAVVRHQDPAKEGQEGEGVAAGCSSESIIGLRRHPVLLHSRRLTRTAKPKESKQSQSPPLLHPPDPRPIASSSRSIFGRRRHRRPLHRLACSILAALHSSSSSPPPIYLAGALRRSRLPAHRLCKVRGEEARSSGFKEGNLKDWRRF